MRVKQKSNSSGKKKIGFLILILLLGALAFAGFKTVKFFQTARASRINLNETLNILITDPSKDAVFISLRGEDNEVAVLEVEGSALDRMGQNWQPADYTWNIDILPDVQLVSEKIDLDKLDQNPKSYLLSLMEPRKSALGSQLPFWVKLQLWRYIWGVDSSRFSTENLNNFITQNKDKEGIEAFSIDHVAMSRFAQKRFSSSVLKRSAVELSILNASDRSGLGGVLSDILSNYGYHVIKVDNSNSTDQSQLIRTNIQMKEGTIESHLRFLFGNNQFSTSDTPQNFQEFRSDFTILIGRNEASVGLMN